MAESRRQLILEAVKERLDAIHVSSGFQTDAGATVFLGEAPQLGKDDPDTAIAIVVGDDEIRQQQPGKKILLTLPISVQAIAKADLDVPWEAIEAMLSDIKTAMELDDLTLGGLAEQEIQRGSTRTIPREPGSTTVGVAIAYPVNYSEKWGHP